MSTLWTFLCLFRHRPRTIYLQHSFALAVIVACWKRLVPWQVVVVDDCHTKALRRSLRGPLGSVFGRLRNWSLSTFDLITLATPSLEPEARTVNPRIRVLPDPLHEWEEAPEVSAVREELRLREGPPIVTAVSSFADDEPVEALLESMKLVPRAQFRITGRPPRELATGGIPDNARLTGFLPQRKYQTLLEISDCVVVLTKDEGCFLSGAGEALSCAKPLVTSDTKALKSHFGEAAVYVKPEAGSIARGIISALDRAEDLSKKARLLRRQKLRSQREAMTDLKRFVVRLESAEHSLHPTRQD